MSSIEYITSTILSSDTSSPITFSNIPQNYTDLIIAANVQFSAGSGTKIRFNTDSGSNYSLTCLIAYSAGPYSGRVSNASSIHNNIATGDSTTANTFTPYTINIMSYSNSSIYKTILWEYATATTEVGTVVELWRNTNAISTIEISPYNAVSYKAGTNFTFWGVK